MIHIHAQDVMIHDNLKILLLFYLSLEESFQSPLLNEMNRKSYHAINVNTILQFIMICFPRKTFADNLIRIYNINVSIIFSNIEERKNDCEQLSSVTIINCAAAVCSALYVPSFVLI